MKAELMRPVTSVSRLSEGVSLASHKMLFRASRLSVNRPNRLGSLAEKNSRNSYQLGCALYVLIDS